MSNAILLVQQYPGQNRKECLNSASIQVVQLANGWG